jgi:hypothetical protein
MEQIQQLGNIDRPELWERQHREPTRAFQAFATYRDMGPERAIRKLAQDINKSVTLLATWSVRWFWQERVEAYEDHMERIKLRAQEQEREEMGKRQAHEGKTLQDFAVAALASLIGPDGRPKADARLTPSVVARLMEVGVKIERLARGESTENVKEDGGVMVVEFPVTVEDDEQWAARCRAESSQRAQSNMASAGGATNMAG